MFVSSEWDSKSNSLIMMRKGKGDSLVNNYMVSRLIVLDPMDKYSYETERSNFIGRGQMLNNPISISKKLSKKDLRYRLDILFMGRILKKIIVPRIFNKV